MRLFFQSPIHADFSLNSLFHERDRFPGRMFAAGLLVTALKFLANRCPLPCGPS